MASVGLLVASGTRSSVNSWIRARAFCLSKVGEVNNQQEYRERCGLWYPCLPPDTALLKGPQEWHPRQRMALANAAHTGPLPTQDPMFLP